MKNTMEVGSTVYNTTTAKLGSYVMNNPLAVVRYINDDGSIVVEWISGPRQGNVTTEEKKNFKSVI